MMTFLTEQQYNAIKMQPEVNEDYDGRGCLALHLTNDIHSFFCWKTPYAAFVNVTLFRKDCAARLQMENILKHCGIKEIENVCD